MHALLLIDIQNDFMPQGPLPVPQGDEIVPIVNRLQRDFELVVATQDWHPPDHGSLAINHEKKKAGDVIELAGLQQILWPAHCIQETSGAELVSDLDMNRIARVFRKGTDPTLDSYSGFFDNAHRKSTGLGEYLRRRGVDAVSITGVATDYCVKFSALDARELGFETTVIQSACRGIELEAGDVTRAFDEMRAGGARVA